MKPWTLAAFALGIVFFVLAVRPDVYELTSPNFLSWHVALRKAYSIMAFSLVGYAAQRAFDEHAIERSAWLTVPTVAVYSLLIEVVQALMGSHEGLGWNTFDVACGAIGGAIGFRFAQPSTSRIR